MVKEKFTFTPEWQLDLINYITLDRDGAKALELIIPDYFTLLDHAIIVQALKDFYKVEKRVPGKTFLKEEVLKLLRTQDYVNTFNTQEKKDIIDIINHLYQPIRDGDIILRDTAKWASYVELKSEIESVNLMNFEEHQAFSSRVMKAISIGNLQNQSATGTFLIKDIEERQLARASNEIVIPTPFRQINRLTNAGGYEKGSIIVILDRPKKAKTTVLVNVAKGYLKRKKKIFVVDLENGQDSLAMRFEQSVAGISKSELLSSKYDKYVKKVLRKYRRLGGEIYIRRFPAFTTTTAHLQAEMDLMYQLHGIVFTDLIIDYPGLMGSMSKKSDDTERISDVYVDLTNLILANGIDHTWVAHHVVRAAEKRMATVYQENDIAKCIDIVRHVHALYGLNRNEREEEEGILRMELIAQRDGLPHGRALFNSDLTTQRVDEMTNEEVRNYHQVNEELIKNIEEGQYKGDM
jgi:replicative DNA helicase